MKGMLIDLTARREPRLKTSVALPRDVQQEAHAVAVKHGISLSEYVVRLLQSDLAQRKLGDEFVLKLPPQKVG